MENYLKYCYVSLMSAKITNPDCEIALVANHPIPDKFEHLFSEHGIKIVSVPFDNYRVPDTFKWELAFYKLKVIEYMAEQAEYDFYLGVDTDTYFSGYLDELWEECSSNLPVLYPLAASPNEPTRKYIRENYKKIFGKDEPIIQIGGEFLAGSLQAFQKLADQNRFIYNTIREKDFPISTDSGDEALLSMSASNFSFLPALPYVRRYWGRKAYYNVDSAWDHIPIWHLPAEKNYGLDIMYRYIIKKGRLPAPKEAARMFNLPCQNKYSISMIKYYIYRLLH